MADAPKILGTDSLRQAYPKLNKAIDNSNEALSNSDTAVANSSSAVDTAITAETKADSVQEQFNQVVIKGDSSVEAAQARVKADGSAYDTLRERLNASDEQLAQKAKQSDVNFLVTNKADVSYVDLKVTQVASGAPKITTSTLAELQANYPNGSEDNAVVTADGHIYNWSGSVWVDTGIIYQAVGIGSNAVGFTQLRGNNADTSILKDSMLTDDLIELFNPNTLTVGKALSGYTDVLVDSPNDLMTDYISMPANSSLIYTVDGVNALTLTGATRKIGVWDSDFKFLYTVRINEISEFVPTVNCNIRIVFQNSDINISIKNTKTKKISRTIIGKDSAFDYYKSKELIEHFDIEKADKTKSYSEETGNLIDSTGLLVTDYIFLPAYHRLSFGFNGLNWTDSPAKSVASSKIVVFNNNKNWEYTRRLNRISSDNFVFPEDKYVRIQALDTYTPTIKVENLYKLDYKKIEVADYQEKDSGYDVFLFMGQSNMAGRGEDTTKAPNASEIAYEFRAITDPIKLNPLVEPFGVNENITGSIDDGTKKTGSMVSAFAKSYHRVTGRKLIGISASEGGTSTTQWLQGTAKYNDTLNRLNTFKSFAATNEIKISHIYMVWCQGEGDAHMTQLAYESNLNNIVNGLISEGVEKCFLIRIGHLDGDLAAQASMIQSQTNICKSNENIILVGNRFAEMHSGGLNLMKADGAHYLQEGYNIQGEQAGINTAYYIKNLKEPTMYDKEYNELYFSYKN